MAVITVGDLRKYEKSPETLAVMDIFLETHQFSNDIPSKKITTLNSRVIRQVSLPTPGFRQLGQPFPDGGKASVDWAEESVFSVGGDIDSDKEIEKDTSVTKSPLQANVEAYSKALSYVYNDVAINGNRALNPDAPDGLLVRIDAIAAAGSPGSDQKMDATAFKASGINISPTGYTDADGDAFLDALDTLIYACDMDGANALLMDDKIYLRTWSVLRRLKLLDTTKDQFGRKINSYQGVKLIDVGRKLDQTTRILDVNMDGTGKSSIIAVKYGENYFHQLTYTPMKAQNLGLLPTDGVTLRWHIDWTFGFAMPHPRSAARLTGIQHS